MGVELPYFILVGDMRGWMEAQGRRDVVVSCVTKSSPVFQKAACLRGHGGKVNK